MDNAKSLSPNAMKVNFTEDKFSLSFALIEREKDEESNIIDAVTLDFSPEDVLSMTSVIISSVAKYQEEFKKNLGLEKAEFTEGDQND